MANPSKNRGTAAETAIVRWAQANGFPHAQRFPPSGNRDMGDLTLCPGIIVEAKDHARVSGGIPAATLREWMRQTELERTNARADIGILVVKRAGTADVGRWFAYLPLWALCEVTTGIGWSHDMSAPVCLDIGSLVPQLRAAGWGQPLDGEVAS